MKKIAYFLRNLQTSRVNNSRILRIKNAKFSGYCFEHEQIVGSSNLHYCTFKIFSVFHKKIKFLPAKFY